jgi:tRNA pseudouridine55 synthase
MTAVATVSSSRTLTDLKDGVLNIRKEAGWTSHDVVARLRTTFGGGKVGHAGTLDPAATGVLPILIGKATRIAEYLLTWDKQYLVELRLGERTDTQDATGTVTDRRSVAQVTDEAVRQAVGRFTGRISQLPPMYSAVKVKGVPLYKAARAGREIERETREVTIDRIDVIHLSVPDVALRVVCSKGTYMRTLCADIGDVLGVGGHMRALERERVGPLAAGQAITVGEAELKAAAGTLDQVMLTLDEALQALPFCTVSPEAAKRILHGGAVPTGDIRSWKAIDRTDGFGSEQPIRIKNEQGQLLAIGRCSPEGKAGAGHAAIVPIKVLSGETDSVARMVTQ